MAIRTLNTNLRNSLLIEEPFAYAHLVKFEKPLKTEGGKSARRAKDYIYVTDGSRDIVFNDGSSDVAGNANGNQTYVANKLTKVGAVSETIQAKASSMTLNVSSAALKTTLTTTLTTTASPLTATDDLVEAGFREGDLVTIYNGTNDSKSVRINTFSNNNLTANITAIDTISSESSATRTLQLSSPEVEGVISNRSSNSYARYINRDVFVYKVHIDISTGAAIGAPYLIFKGIISQGKISEDVTKSSIVSWTLTSHWADFSRVQGRLTSDSYHRALDGNNKPDPEALTRPAYAKDLGFAHSEQAVNLIATYQVNETRYKEKKRGGLAGLFGGKRLVEYEVEVDRETDLRFNLDAKYLPVVYGVNKIDSIPFFVDALNSDAKKVFCAYALCEGEVGGIYDVYLDDTSSICIDENDKDTRSQQTSEETVDVLCVGRMDQGDTLTGQNVLTGSTFSTSGHSESNGYIDWAEVDQAEKETYQVQYDYQAPTASAFTFGASNSAAGITHEKGTSFTSPINAKLLFHSGKEEQRADQLLLRNAANFKLGTDYYNGSADYWGGNHKVLDTAYAVVEYTIGEGDTTIPSLDFVVRGKGLKCFNYDFSYEQHPSYTSSDDALSNFNLGEEVTIKKTSDNSTLGTVKIADIYAITEMSGAAKNLIRFMEKPPIGSTTSFYMTSGGNTYHMQTYDNSENTGAVQTTLSKQITSASANSNGVSTNITFGTLDSTFIDAFTLGSAIAISGSDAGTFTKDKLNHYSFAYSGSGNTITNVGNTGTNASNLVNSYVILKNCVRLASTASSSDDAYNGLFIEITKTLNDGSILKQKRQIVDYDGGSRIAKVSSVFEEEQLPTSGDTYKILSTDDDIRVSTNPAIQLLDYLTSKRYGRDLDIEEDIDLESFLASARACDTRSDVTILTTVVTVQVGAVYQYAAASGKVLFQGEVKSITSETIGGTAYKSIVLTNVLGKLVHRWENWKYFYTDELYYYEGALHKASSNGIIGNTPSTTPGVSTFNITKVSGSGAANIVVDRNPTRKTFDGNPVIKEHSGGGSFSSGYNLYDCDDVKYWRYLGWEAQNQRHVTRHQTNAVINTNKPIFDNINGMLGHFNGMLRYSNGKYSLGVKGTFTAPSTITVNSADYIAEDIDEGDIIGSIAVEDAGQKGTYNQIDVAINDPQNRFESRSVALFNSTYLKEDRMVPKKGSIRTPYITNYYNARINAKQYLEESRSSLKIGFTVGPKGILFVAGNVIRVTYPRFGWTNKLFRVSNLTFNENCTTQVTAFEHSDDAYLITAPVAKGVIQQVEPGIGNIATPIAPSGLNATQNDRGGIELTWTNSSSFNAATYSVQIWRGTANNLTHSTTKLVGTSKSDIYTDIITGEGAQTLYYWIRYSVLVPNQRINTRAPREVFSAYHPVSPTGGVIGISDGARDAISVNLTNDNVSVLADGSGTPTSFNNTNISITAFIGSTALNYDDTSPYGKPSFRVSNATISSGITAGAASSTSTSYVRQSISAMSADTGSITYTIIVTDSLGGTTTFEKVQTFTKSRRGVDGVPGQQGQLGQTGATGPRTASAVLYYQSSSSSAPTAPTASGYSFSTGLFASHTSGWAEQAPTFAAGNANKYWYVRVTIEESSYAGTQSISIGNVIQGIGFTGLVTFTSSQEVGDGNNSLSFGEQGTTTIDGGQITTGTIDAQRLNVGQINVTQTLNYQANPTQVGQLQNNSGYQTNAFTQPAQINVTQTNNYAAPPTNTNQLTNGAGFQTNAFTNPGQINVAQTQNYQANPTQISQLQNNQNFQSGLSNLSQFTNGPGFQSGLSNLSQFQNGPGYQTQAFTQPGQINVTQTTNYVTPPSQTSQLSNNSGFQTAAIQFSATAISGGKIGLSTAGLIIGNGQTSISSSNTIILDTTQGNNTIKIFDGGTLRVKIGKL